MRDPGEGEAGSATALAYETAEEARLLLQDADDLDLDAARRDVAEAAYYLSDTIEPNHRASLLAFAKRRRPPSRLGEEREARAADALTLLADATADVEALVRGPSASSELLIARRALRRAINGVAVRMQLPTNQVTADGLRGQALAVLRRLHA